MVPALGMEPETRRSMAAAALGESLGRETPRNPQQQPKAGLFLHSLHHLHWLGLSICTRDSPGQGLCPLPGLGTAPHWPPRALTRLCLCYRVRHALAAGKAPCTSFCLLLGTGSDEDTGELVQNPTGTHLACLFGVCMSPDTDQGSMHRN